MTAALSVLMALAVLVVFALGVTWRSPGLALAAVVCGSVVLRRQMRRWLRAHEDLPECEMCGSGRLCAQCVEQWRRR